MKPVNYDEVMSQLENHLEEYLNSHGINTNDKFLCINPLHNDTNPSCSIQGPNEKKTFHCWSCGVGGSIIHAAYYLEGMPTGGKGFVVNTLLPLAERFNIEVILENLSEGDRYAMDTYKAYRIATKYISTANISDEIRKEIERRGWDRKLCEEMGVGSIENLAVFKEYLSKEKAGASMFLKDIELLKKEMFNENNLIFSIKDEWGQTVGYASRKVGETKERYMNTSTSAKISVYKKNERLFGFDRVLRKFGSKPRSIYIMEGYTDVLSSIQNGLENCVALGSNSFSEEQLDLLKQYNFFNIVLCLDGDTGGHEGTSKAIDKLFGSHKDMTVKVVDFPKGEDPDSFFRNNSLEEFKRLNEWSAFEWRLNQFDENDDNEEICRKVIPLIVSEPNYIKQESMMRELSRATGFDILNIQQEVKRLQDSHERQKELEREKVIMNLIQTLNRKPQDAEILISSAQGRLYDLMRQYNEDSLSPESSLAKVDGQKRFQEEQDGSFSGYVLGPDLEIFSQVLNGNWKEAIFGVVGGKANCLSKETKLFDPIQGKYEKIIDIAHTYSLDINNKKIVIDSTIDYIDSGKQECFEVISDTGHSEEVTRKHKFLTKTGWKKLKDLKVGDIIAAPSFLPNLNKTSQDIISEKEALFMGLMIGDGNFTQPRPLFTNDDPEVLKVIKSIVSDIFGSNIQCPIYKKRNENPNYEMIGLTQKNWKTNRDLGGRCISNPVTLLLKKWELYGHTASSKKIPKFIFNSSISIMKQILIGLFTTDGSVYQTKDREYIRYTIDFSSKSEILVRQVQALLLRFGIVAFIRKKYCGLFESWYLTIRDRKSVHLYLTSIGFIGNKSNRINPKTIDMSNIRSKYDGDIYWAKLKSIKSVGIKDTCDITINKTSNFMTDGFILHNSGKTSFLVKLGYEIARRPYIKKPDGTEEKVNDAVVIYHSIDDTIPQLLPKFICVASQTKNLKINEVINPNYYVKNGRNIIEARDNGYNKIRAMISAGRLILKDANDGQNLAFVESLIKYYKTKYPSRNLVYILDNFHKLQDLAAASTDRGTYKSMSQTMKRLAGKFPNVCILCTVEYTKMEPGTRPSNNNISECLTGDTLIYNPLYGEHIRIDNCKKGDLSLSLDEKQKIIPSYIEALIDKGIQKVYKVTLKSGKFLKTTLNHPFFSENGWEKLINLKVGDFIGVPRELKVLNKFNKDEENEIHIARILGLLAGDGCYRKKSTPSFINNDIKLIEYIEKYIKLIFGITAKRTLHNGSINLSFGNKRNNLNPFVEFLKEKGIWGQIGEDKTIPKYIFKSSKAIKSAYISGLIETDGSIQGTLKEKRITFTNKSPNLTYGLQSLLLNFEIQTTIHLGKNNLFRLNVRNWCINKFQDSINLIGRKSIELKDASIQKQKLNFSDVLPPVFTKLIKESRKLEKKTVKYSDEFYIQKPTISRQRAQFLQNEFIINKNEIKKWANSDIFWDKISSIEYLGEEHVWDLTIKDTHNFIANNIFCHNTVQIDYDANLALHLFNELHDKKDRALDYWTTKDEEGIIHKHPRIEVIFGKNKITDFKGVLYFDFIPACSEFTQVPKEQVEEERSIRRTQEKENKGKNKIFD